MKKCQCPLILVTRMMENFVNCVYKTQYPSKRPHSSLCCDKQKVVFTKIVIVHYSQERKKVRESAQNCRVELKYKSTAAR